ncbi:MAG: tRNA lysidine(34) synthetase TilS [Treponema sp.]|nr:tRNA lysidine(34) synthetase TilS [Treponema sp.]
MNFFESVISAALNQPQTGKLYLAAVSGGADSTAMLTGLAALRETALREKAPFSLCCLHVEHGIRPAVESRADAQAVMALCEKLGVPCRVVSIPPGKIAAFAARNGCGIEAAARLFRHRALKREARRIKADSIVLGHTRDDLLENILMRILRGSGPAGLAPMRSKRGRILRPLLELSRQDILKYLEEKGIPYRTDSTNTDIKFLRNRVRHKLVPLLDEFFPAWRSSLTAMAETQALTAEFLSSEARERMAWEKEPGELPFFKLKEEDFFRAPPILREEAIFAAADKLAGSKLPGKVPRRLALRRSLEQGPGGRQFIAADLGPVRLERQNGFITLRPVKKLKGERGFSFLIKDAGLHTLEGRIWGGRKARGKDLRIRVSEQAALPMVFRNHEEGDLLIKGGHKRRFSDILDGSVRSRYTDIITVCDAQGTAAFIAIGPSEGLLVIGRDEIKAGDLSFMLGGENV